MNSENRQPPTLSTSRAFLSRTLTKRDSVNSSEDSKGSLGLNTLYTPLSDSAVADLVFVHGLRGGSRSTWTKSGDPALYWPKEWLPNDEAFQDVRIHSYGYDSDWEHGSTLGIQDFAKALLGSIHDCHIILRDPSVGLTLFVQPNAIDRHVEN